MVWIFVLNLAMLFRIGVVTRRASRAKDGFLRGTSRVDLWTTTRLF
jgi:hypothetical protein